MENNQKNTNSNNNANNFQFRTNTSNSKQSSNVIDDSKLNLQTVFFVLRSRLVWIILSAILLGSLVALYSVFFITPTYSSTAKFFVNNRTGEFNTSISSADINASQSLAETSIVLIQNNSLLLEEVIEESGVEGYTPGLLKGMISASVDSGTEVFYIKITTPSTEDSYKLALSFREIIPKALPENIIEGVTIKPFDEPKIATSHDYPNITSNTIIGAVIGLIASFLFFFIKEVLDITIYTEEDIKDRFNYPVIGLIPNIVGTESEEKEVRSSHSKKSKKKAKEA